jgi:hypothetical protein
MPCNKPIIGYRSKFPNKNGKKPLVFDYEQSDKKEDPIKINCGQCEGCRLIARRAWALRCYHESSLHDTNYFLTLTYDEENLPPNESLNHDDVQKFLKRLRKKLGKFRYFMAGEYGKKGNRPHYHILMFGLEVSDLQIHPYANKRLTKDNNVFTSDTIQQTWKKGDIVIGSLTMASCLYTAKYVQKKATGKLKKVVYGERVPEYAQMSRRPGIAKEWFDKYGKEIYNDDIVMLAGGVKLKPPKYYDENYKQINSEHLEVIKNLRMEHFKETNLLEVDPKKLKNEKFLKHLKNKDKYNETL